MQKTRAFTLIELLTVIAILGALLALVMPGLSQVREEARRTVCASNQRGIGHAFILYARTDPAAFPAVAQVFDGTTGNMQIFNPDDRTIEMQGVSPGSVPLVVWIPGDGEPGWDGEGMGEPHLRKVPGGWTLTAEPRSGEWSIRIQGR